MDDFRKEQNSICGVGGINCPCCNPYGAKSKPKLNRLVRARLKEKTKKLIKQEEEGTPQDRGYRLPA